MTPEWTWACGYFDWISYDSISYDSKWDNNQNKKCFLHAVYHINSVCFGGNWVFSYH